MFTFGVIVGLVVGGIIVYQILFADVSDHLAEYATLKAMGYSNRYLVGRRAPAGGDPGRARLRAGPRDLRCCSTASSGEATRLPLEMTLAARRSACSALTVAMCCVSALIALRKVRSADPAEIF